MDAAGEQIRVSTAVKREIERRRRKGESYNDVLERLFGTDRNRGLLTRAGFWSAEEAEEFREHQEAAKEESKERRRCSVSSRARARVTSRASGRHSPGVRCTPSTRIGPQGPYLAGMDGVIAAVGR